MFNVSRFKKSDLGSVKLNPVSVVLVPCDSVEHGSIVRKSEFKSVDNSVYLSQFVSSDFSISSLMAIGAMDKMKTCIVNTSRISAADSFDNFNIQSDVQQA